MENIWVLQMVQYLSGSSQLRVEHVPNFATAVRAAGIAYYPDKYWALAVPIWIFALGLYVAWAYEGVNRMTVRSRDDEDLIQERTGSILTAVEDPEPEVRPHRDDASSASPRERRRESNVV